MSDIFSSQNHRNRVARPVPRLQPVKRRRRAFSRKRGILIVVAIVCCAGIYFIGHHLLASKQSPSMPNAPAPTKALKRNQMPTFSTLVPNGKSIDSLGGWTRVSPDNTAPVYAYTDKIDGAMIIVSEQQLPSSFGVHSDKALADFAASFNATEKLFVGTRIAYIASAKSGQQMLVYATDELLILIKSSTNHSNDAWVRYLSSLN